jgi:transposase
MTKDEEIEHLRQENEILRGGLKQALLAIDFLQERVKELERQKAKESHNSSLPPSSDRLVRVPKSLRQKSGKKAGGQLGHRGHHLPQVEAPDEVLIHPVEKCDHCQHDLREQPANYPERRQVMDLPEKRLWVKEHRVQEKDCPHCAHVTRASFPPEVKAAAQYGQGIAALAVAVYLVEGQVVPYARASQVLQDVLGVQLSAGSIASFLQHCHEALAPVEQQLKVTLHQQPLLHLDETPMRVGTTHRWVHVSGTQHLTYYASHLKRGGEALEAIGIVTDYQGTIVHDGWTAYQAYPCQHALCNVHHLRELTFIEEQYHQEWAKQIKELLLEKKTAVENATLAGKRELDVLALGRFHRRYELILTAGYQANPPPAPIKKTHGGHTKQHPARNLLDRLWRYKWHVLAFLIDFTVPFSNNQAERDLRMVKVQQKVSGCFRTEQGLTRFCRIRSSLSTLLAPFHAIFYLPFSGIELGGGSRIIQLT